MAMKLFKCHNLNSASLRAHVFSYVSLAYECSNRHRHNTDRPLLTQEGEQMPLTQFCRSSFAALKLSPSVTSLCAQVSEHACSFTVDFPHACC